MVIISPFYFYFYIILIGSSIRLPIQYLDATDLTQWKPLVLEPAISAINSFLSSSLRPAPNSPQQTLLSWKKYTCDICNGRVLNGPNEWDSHCNSSAHI